ncbi:MAG: serine/threonine protein kinase [Bradymonadales bacterium]|nr:serine/threonine protein kinase [Bradymonadales bacterium]
MKEPSDNDRPTIEHEATNPEFPPSTDPDRETVAITRTGEMIAGRYRLLKTLGVGGFATVYEAEDIKIGGRVAVKVLGFDKSFVARHIARFDQEVQIVRELRHPNTIKVWDVGITEDGCLYMVMEHLEGRTLAQELGTGQPISEHRALVIIEQVLKSLSEAHQRGIVHRDLKPENVMLCENQDGSEFVKVLDFGVAKPLTQDLSFVKTQTGVVMGTPGYAAPEVLLGSPPTPAADVYGVGLLLVEMLTGYPVIPVTSLAQMVTAQLSLDTKRLTVNLTTEPLAILVRKALESKPKKRYPSAVEMLEDVGRILRPDQSAVLEESRPEPPKEVEETEAQLLTLGLADTVELLAGDQDLPGTTSEPEEKVQAGEGLVGSEQDSTRPSYDGAQIEREPVDGRRRSPVAWFWLLLLAGLLGGGAALVMSLRDPAPSTLDRLPVPITETLPQPTVAEHAQPTEAPRLSPPLPPLPGPSMESLDWDWMAALEREPRVSALVVGPDRQDAVSPLPEEQPQPRILIMESALLNQQAIEMLESALTAGQIAEDRQEESLEQLMDLHERLIRQLVELGRCPSARRRLDSARASIALLPLEATDRLALLEPEIQACSQRERVSGVPWDAVRYRALVQQGTDLYQQAAGMPAEELERRHGLLQQSAALHLEAREMLQSILADPLLPADRREEIHQTRWWLDSRLVAIECALDRCGAAELQLDEMLSMVQSPQVLAAFDPLSQAVAGTAGEVLAPESALVGTSDLHVLAADSADRADDQAVGQEAVTQGGATQYTMSEQEEQTLLVLQADVVQCKQRAADIQAEFDWAALMEMVETSRGLYDQASTLMVEYPAEPAEIAIAQEEPPIFRARLRLSSDPEGAQVSWGRRVLGVTPLMLDIESSEGEVVLAFERDGYLRRRLAVDMTQGEFRRRVLLEPEPEEPEPEEPEPEEPERQPNPFGTIRLMGGE